MFGNASRCDPFIEFVQASKTQYSQPVENFKNFESFTAWALFPDQPQDSIQISLFDCDPYAVEHPRLARLRSDLTPLEKPGGNADRDITVIFSRQSSFTFEEGKLYTGRFHVLDTAYEHLNSAPEKNITCSVRVSRTTVHENVLSMVSEIQKNKPGNTPPTAKASRVITRALTQVGVVSLAFACGILMRPLLFGAPAGSKPSSSALAWNLVGSLFFNK